MINSGRLQRQTGRRRLRAARPRVSRPRRHPARHRRPQPGDRARARFRSRLPEPRQCLVRARQLRPGASPTTTRPSSSIPIRPRLTSTAPPCGATSATPKARWQDYQKGDQSRRQSRHALQRARTGLSAPEGLRARARRFRPRRATSNRAPTITCCARRRAKAPAISIVR